MGSWKKSNGLRAWHLLRRYVRSRRGNISLLVALLAVPLAGVMGMATEAGGWYLTQRAAQNAADSAVLAAGQNDLANATPTSSTAYINEGRAVATNLGFSNGTASGMTTAVNVFKNQTCPAPLSGSVCYKVTITRTVPVYLPQVVGYSGTSGSQTIGAAAIAGPVNVLTKYCVLTLATSGEGIRANGTPNFNLNGCNVATNSTSTSNGHPAVNCNGHGLGAGVVSAPGDVDSICGSQPISGAPAVTDPYASLKTTNASDLTNNTCGSPAVYNGATWGTAGASTPVQMTLPATPTKICGNLKLLSDVTITSASPGSVVVIQNGQLDLNGFTLKTASGSGLTIVFNQPSGTSNLVPLTGSNGTLDIAAPTSGPWSGVALYQSRQNASTAIQALTYTGNQPTWMITGLVYFPYIDLAFKGAVNKSSYGYSCLTLVTNTLDVSGTGNIYANMQSQCVQAGNVQPSNVTSSRVALVQ